MPNVFESDEKIITLLDEFRHGSALFTPTIPPTLGGIDASSPDTRAELAAVLYSVTYAGNRFRLAALGAAPGEWAVRTERAYRARHPSGDFQSVNLEGDEGHFEMTKQFLAANGADTLRNDVRYQVIADKEGFAYFPIVKAGVDWGAGIAAVSSSADDLDDNITMNDQARRDRIAANDGKPLEFRTVPAVTIASLVAEFERIDLIHCDIQGAEREVFPASMAPLNAAVGMCCVATHGRDIERMLLALFEQHGWDHEVDYPCHTIDDNGEERTVRDGVFIWTNPRVFGKPYAERMDAVSPTRRGLGAALGGVFRSLAGKSDSHG